MTATLNGFAGPDEPNQLSGEVKVVITIPEEFTGASLHELIAREGLIADMTTHGQSVTVHGSLPISKLNALIEAIRLDTQGRGRVALADGR